MLNNQPTAADLIAQFNILDLFAEVADIKKSGSEHVCLCPFHQEKTPSCYINETKQSFHCRGCGAGGGAVSFFMSYYQIDKGEAFQLMRGRLGISGGDEIEPAPLRLTEKGEIANTLKVAAEIEEPYFFSEYGLVSPIHYTYKGEALVTLSAHGKPVDHLLESEFRGGKLTEEGCAYIGQYSRRICLFSDYIDAIYLSQQLARDTLVVFCGHPSRLNWAEDYMKTQHKDAEIIAAVPNIWDHTKYAEMLSCPVITAPEIGYWCEKSRRQDVK